MLAAAELLCCPYGGQIAAKAITISTVGLVPEIDRLHRRGAQVPAVDQPRGGDRREAGRDSCPSPSRWPVAEVMAAARRYALARRDRVMLSYVCISGENVGEDDARALGDLIGDTPVRLDLIDVTDPTGRFRPPDCRGAASLPRRPDPSRRPAGRPALFGRHGHSGRLRDAGGRDLELSAYLFDRRALEDEKEGMTLVYHGLTGGFEMAITIRGSSDEGLLSIEETLLPYDRAVPGSGHRAVPPEFHLDPDQGWWTRLSTAWKNPTATRGSGSIWKSSPRRFRATSAWSCC